MPQRTSLIAVLIASVLTGCAPRPIETVSATPGTGPHTHIVCPTANMAADCAFAGGSGIQAAIDAAADGDTVQLRAGTYSATAVRDVPYRIHTIRGFVVIDGKRLSLVGEPGVVLDGGTGPRSTGIVVNRANLEVRGLTLTGFKFDVEEDEIYEGHGIFAMDSRVRLHDVTIEKYQKMGLTGRGDTILDVDGLRILDGHVAIWLHETAYLRLSNAVIRGNDSSAIAAYDNSTAHVANSVIDRNIDDGLYTEHDASIYVTNSIVVNNKPYAAHALGNSKIWLGYSALFGNENAMLTKDAASVRKGPNVIEQDPKLDAEYRQQPQSPLAGKGDPDFGTPVSSPSQIGLR
ncbi:right-handed parallel beta-helix repeat-containing protein [Peristeroidobacter soli]|uniref:right-handed parallel beta-helix repeat-containing protein n=1 Tax=Peristeroidobacter soli TaxID=2497877 RepID=UPI00101D3273|nr:right-handed parallel beta-helix repeat-containing protein [Peristeroidobacter soli]